MSDLEKGITREGEGYRGKAWNILGQRYFPKASCASTFAFETNSEPGQHVPVHIHPTQDEFIWVMEGAFDLYLDGSWTKAGKGDLVCMPKGLVHAYYNRGDVPARALFWVTPGRRLKELFDALHDLTDPAEVVRRSAACDHRAPRPRRERRCRAGSVGPPGTLRRAGPDLRRRAAPAGRDRCHPERGRHDLTPHP